MKVLVVEDERRMAELLRKGLTEEGHTVHCAHDGHEGLRVARMHEFDVIVLDVMMPTLSGYEVAQRLRAENNPTAVLMLTAKDSVLDIVHGLDLGADDYLTKPFSFQELLVRLQVVKRRAMASVRRYLQVDDLILNCETREVSRSGERINLTRKEYALLFKLMFNAGMVVSRKSLVESTWGAGHEIDSNQLDAFVRLLRNKVDSRYQQKLIQTIRRVGYVISAAGNS